MFDKIHKVRLYGLAFAILVIILAAAVSPWAAIGFIPVIFGVPFATCCYNDRAFKEMEHVEGILNSEIFGGALLRSMLVWGNSATTTRMLVYEVVIDMTRLRAARSTVPQVRVCLRWFQCVCLC